MKADVTKDPSVYSSHYPEFFEAAGVDKLLAICMTLAQELSVTNEKLSDLEEVLIKKEVLSRLEIEELSLTEAERNQRNTKQQDFINRLLRVFDDELKELETK